MWLADPESLSSGIAAILQLVELSAAQDVEAGDGTTSVVVLAGSLLGAAEKMLSKGESERVSVSLARLDKLSSS